VGVDGGDVRAESHRQVGGSRRKSESRKRGGKRGAEGNDGTGAEEAPGENVEPLHVVTPRVEFGFGAASQG